MDDKQLVAEAPHCVSYVHDCVFVHILHATGARRFEDRVLSAKLAKAQAVGTTLPRARVSKGVREGADGVVLHALVGVAHA